MKSFVYLLCIIGLIACKGKPATLHTDSVAANSITNIKTSATPTPQHSDVAKDSVFKPYTLIDNFIVTDTGYFDFVLGSSTYAVIKQNNKLVDTIDLFYGINKVNEGFYMYAPVVGNGTLKAGEVDSRYKKSIRAYIDGFVLMKNGRKQPMAELAPNFGYFASPAIINHKIYYWQVKEINTTNAISAAVFDPVSKSTKSIYLFNEALETDDDGHFPAPYLNGDTIIFESGEKTRKLSPSFKPYK